ncbi:bifunctional 4-hydroxy-2-oxoglutarate aldolase/2-dehydro-3-deoxy-phosphogluconate aldolase [Nocardiopsis sp. JB363]|uniref:bifunctional 4-hydroxy-2-oxoglutarate aldolase/2-dehydro-3-deoxy-phosphogluconate aldolase n=1 Tax=Nocardiopsis sp. JB363 TaxID=1434837 RepID=UPI00097AFEEA|nr:bifunctional 4-hydroxy-2-oxoglutarate aldolase/2-dehydro-3-deoxy-phosphogluconate aldolase [Nocardiopsis sp. JB363]SIO90143.1 4-hydroxy-2-oxoglutarate aldolase @ 2-dehydro-3-deoxyphosphogluconate aldolase [Nocardiopsis sp. JB363]
MTGSKEEVLEELGAAGILPVLRTSDPSRLRDQVHRLHESGAKVVELTTSIPEGEARLAEFTEAMPDMVWGMGTVTEPAVAERALRHGASFLVSPYPVPEVRHAVAGSGTLLIEGGHTPGELASVAGAGIAKVFPAHVGGTRYLRSLAPVLPGCRLVPSGGIGPGQVPDWLAAGAFAVAVGSELFGVDDLAGHFAAAREQRSEVER